jgi:hypothetical protein
VARLKSIAFLIAIVLVWGYLISTIWQLQLAITLLPWLFPHEKLIYLRKQFWLWQDQGVNVLFLGSADETISSRVGVLFLLGSKTAVGVRWVIDLGFYVAIQQIDHCIASIEFDEQKRKIRKLVQTALEKHRLEGANFAR